MSTKKVVITFKGEFKIEADLDEDALTKFFESASLSVSGQPVTMVADVPGHKTAKKVWSDFDTSIPDLVVLYEEVKTVGKKMLRLIAELWEDGITFDEIKELITDEGDLQRRMNTVLQVARRMGYRDSNGKGVAPWNTEYMSGGKPMYTMHKELADVILALPK